LDSIDVPKIRKLEFEVKKLGKSDIKWSNPYGDQITHFTSYIESLNVKNFFCNCKKTRTTSYT
jgi:hypothetical protein